MNDLSLPQSPRGLLSLPQSLSPRRLVAEIGLLIDHISGRGTRSLLAMPVPAQTAGARDKLAGDPVEQFLRVCADDGAAEAAAGLPPGIGATETLVLTRDWLNSMASPVTGDTIAFSILVGRIRDGRPMHSDDAALAFPSYIWEAQKMDRQYRWTIWVTRLLTAMVFVISAWSIFGAMALSALADLRTRTELLEQEQASKEAAINAVRVGGAAGAAEAGSYVRYCGAPAFAEYRAGRNPAFPIVDAQQIRFCEHKDDLTARRDAAYQTLNFWALGGLPRLGLFTCIDGARKLPAGDGAKPEAAALRENCAGTQGPGPIVSKVSITDDAARAWLAVVAGSILPLFMAMLGSNVAVLRDFFQKVRERLLSPKDRRLYQIRATLGVVAGVAVGFFLAPAASSLPVSAVAGSASSGALASAAALASTTSLSAPALGFIAGFAVDLFFQFLESAAEVMFRRKE